MKYDISHYVLGISLTLLSCSNSNTSTENVEPGKNTETSGSKNIQAEKSSDKGLAGTWKLRLEVFDDNGNLVPDDEEMKKGYSNNYMLQLNADGTCRIQQMFTGRYERLTENGREMLKVYRKKVAGEEDEDPPPDVYLITSLKPDELVLQVMIMGEPSSFWFFNRIN